MKFDVCIGIDYSGAKTPLSRNSGLQIYESAPGRRPRIVRSPSSTPNRRRNWNRMEVACWLSRQIDRGITFIAGIDHGFSFPISYFDRYKIESWQQFLEDFTSHWAADHEDATIDQLRSDAASPALKRTGASSEFRLTELWSSSAKSVFQFDVQGSVAKSTHAGLPWIHRLRREHGDRIHFWPFDGWKPPAGKSILAEVYPSIFRNRYQRKGRTCDQQDAYSVANWLSQMSESGMLERYFDPPLTDDEQRIADLEGWILGIM